MSSYYSGSQALTLNMLEVHFSKDTVQIYVTEFVENVIDEYRESFTQYSFYRNSNLIYAWALVEDPELTLPDEFEPTIINRKNHTLVYNKIVEEAFVYIIRKNGRAIRPKKNSSTWELELSGYIDFNGLQVVPTLNFSFHPLYSVKTSKLILGLSIRYSHKFRFTISESEIKSLNVDTRDWMRNTEGEVAPSLPNVLKFIEGTNQQSAFNKHAKEVNTDVWAYAKLISFHKSLNTISDEDKKKNKKPFKDKLFLPDGLLIKEFALYHLNNSNFSSSDIYKPRYYYYQDRRGEGRFFQEEVKKQKPYSFEKFNNNEDLNILVLTKNTYEGTTGEFIKKLEDILRTTFHLYKIKCEIIPTEFASQSYIDVINNKLSDKQYSLAIVIVNEEDKNKYTIPDSPYYSSKAKLLNRKIPTQKLTIETLRKQETISMENIALNIYSKLGGVAWAIEQTQKERIEIIIGISSTIDLNKNRIIGFANIFDYNGNYLVGDCSHLSTQETYVENLKTYLVQVIRNVIEIKNIGKRDRLRLIFHLSKEAGKETELTAIDYALSQFRDYQIQFAIVHLSYTHNFRIYANEGAAEVKRGTFVQISTQQAIMHFGNKTKIPVLARLDKRSQFKDIYDIAKQVLHFTHLCYRNYRAANVPVTIKYPNLMSKLTHELMQVPNWDSQMLNRIKDQLWFI
ncbi:MULTISPECIES: Piwi domain-containing protein [Xanthocytophaga]|uniref:Protein argonaute n=2 Tax=Xanthocytophaga TaxID=3078918 RepID=A0AAE3QPK3_9BACT|nr:MULTISPECIES: Piwi domain-containing protein [Xanthocytophaga]MDJ1483097.1 Piwi domain-containing protein [Xanthocytophaga flavus]MDJ1503632.1 Piwi domain-containing protein [Xanthocytophaga agilis]